MKIIIKACANCPFMKNDDGIYKCYLQKNVNINSLYIIQELNDHPDWCPLSIEDYCFSVNIESEKIDDPQMTEFNKSIENINSQLDTLKTASDELNQIFNIFNEKN